MSLPHEAFVEVLKRTESLMLPGDSYPDQPIASRLKLYRELSRMDREDVEALAAMIVEDLDRRDDEDYAQLDRANAGPMDGYDPDQAEAYREAKGIK